jgi:hypothetical protein
MHLTPPPPFSQLPLDQICPEDFPPRHAVLHDRRPEHVKHYEETLTSQVTLWNRGGSDLPKTVTRRNCKLAVWKKSKLHETESSVWDDFGGGHVEGAGWVKPIYPEKQAVPLEGDWVAFSSWFIGNFGHFGTYSRLSNAFHAFSYINSCAKKY